MKSNRPMYNKRRRAYKYGIPLDQYDRMVEAQGGKCAICQNERPLVVDHNHSTSVVRSLLCSQCNTGIGQFSDDPNLLRAAADYCEKHANVDIFKAS